MKKTLVFSLLTIISLFSLTGCKSNNSFTCSKNVKGYGADYGDKLTGKVIVNGKYNKKGYINWIEFKTIETAANDKIYKERKAANDESTIETDDDMKTSVDYDDKKRTITITSSFDVKLEDYSEEEKKDLKKDNFIKSLKEQDYKCE